MYCNTETVLVMKENKLLYTRVGSKCAINATVSSVFATTLSQTKTKIKTKANVWVWLSYTLPCLHQHSLSVVYNSSLAIPAAPTKLIIVQRLIHDEELVNTLNYCLMILL